MAFERRQATHITSARHIFMLASVMKKQGVPVVLVPLATSLHAGHLALLRAAQRIPGSLVIVAIDPNIDRSPLIDARVDVIFTYTDADLWPAGLRTLVSSPLNQTAGGAGTSANSVGNADDVSVTRIMTLLGIIGPTDVVLGEKNVRQLVQVQQAITDLHYPVVVHEVSTVRTPEGVPVASHESVDPADPTDLPVAREQTLAVSASLVAGVHAAADGAAAVLTAAHAVLAAVGVEPEELAVYSPMLGPAPEVGDARLVVTATVAGAQITDSVRLVLGANTPGAGVHEAGLPLQGARETESE